jgi:peptidoglycan hydrolase CwlO-like protein
MKQLQALIAAAIITGLVGLGMLAIGVNAATNQNMVPVSNAPGDPPASISAATPQAQAQINRLQDLITQYQNREKQYQAQLDQANTQLQQYQAILSQLQRLGVIRINSDGSIQLRSRGFGRGDDGG